MYRYANLNKVELLLSAELVSLQGLLQGHGGGENHMHAVCFGLVKDVKDKNLRSQRGSGSGG